MNTMKRLLILTVLLRAASGLTPRLASFVSSNTYSLRSRDTFRKLRGGGSHPLTFNATSSDCGSMSVAELWELLESSTDGLTSEEATFRIKQYGEKHPRAIEGQVDRDASS
jgi:hypothetical protein